MAVEREVLRDWHRLFRLLRTDFFSGSPFVVEVERDLSVQQQLLDVVVVRRGRGHFAGRLPDGLEDLAACPLAGARTQHEPHSSGSGSEWIARLGGPGSSEARSAHPVYPGSLMSPANLTGEVTLLLRPPIASAQDGVSTGFRGLASAPPPIEAPR